jgi:hypothetical protein
MPTVLRAYGFRFFFYSLEGSEPPHLAESRGFRIHELNRLRLFVIEHRLKFVEAWNAHFSR